MADVEIKWIKITTDIFNDEKIKIIDTMPARDEILVIWFKLLALAGKSNQAGMLFMNDKIAYTPEMLSAVFNRELNTVNLALTTFQNFDMIEVVENQAISIMNWEKQKNTDGMEKIRLQNAERQKKHRDKKKLTAPQAQKEDSNVTHNVTVTDGHGTRVKKKSKEKEEDKDKKEPKKLYLDSVKLTDEEFKKLVDKFGEADAKYKIGNLNDYVQSTGKKYKSHYHTILMWSKKDKPQEQQGRIKWNKV